MAARANDIQIVLNGDIELYNPGLEDYEWLVEEQSETTDLFD